MSRGKPGVAALGIADINIAQSRGDAVIALLERAEIAPLPVFYSLIYDYLAGAQTLDAMRAGGLVDVPNPDGSAGARLYDEFVRPYEANETLERVVAQLVGRLTTLDALIVERREASRSQQQTLSAASSRLAEAEPDPALMREWIARLAAANDVVRAAKAALRREVELARDELTATRDELARVSRDSLVDPLTAIANRKGLDGGWRGPSRRCARRAPISVAVVDVDHFKRVNDAYGHQTGDAVLRLAARALLASVRGSDFVGRMGGDEFVAVLPGCSEPMAADRAEIIRAAILDSDMTPLLGGDVLGSVTVSIGVASYRDGDSIASLLERADRYLFEAKSLGRNRVIGDRDMDVPEPAVAAAG